ncbi:Putative FBD-associated F-box protein At5g56440 [Linum perenne]
MKKKKKSRIKLVGAGVTSTDRLSSLPDAILDHILSFVDTKTVVQTSILSRRWKCVWKHVPALNLDYCSFGSCFSSFATFVDKVLSLRDPLNVTRVSYFGRYPVQEEEEDEDEEDEEDEDDEDEDEEEDMSSALAATGSKVAEDPLVERVIEYAVFHGASHLNLNVDYSLSKTNGYRFSKSFTSNDLETLSLYCFEIDSRFGSFDFQALTEMVLVYCDFQYGQDEFLDPFSRFPCLKNLCLRYNHKDYSGRANKLRISGPQLQNLKLFDLNIERIEISAPKLKSLTVHPVEIDGFFELDLPSLDYADIKFAGYTTCISHFEEEDWDFFFQGCCNVKSLTLCTEIIEELCYIYRYSKLGPSPFTRLETLNVSIDSMDPKNMPCDIPDKVTSYFFEGSSCSSPSIEFIDRA